MDSFTRNERNAYLGETGRKREEFCKEFIAKKQAIFTEFKASQAKTAAENGETISCGKGCTNCCQAYMQASVAECEAIVYYLYHHKEARDAFLASYPAWRQKLAEHGDIFKECGECWQDKEKTGGNETARAALIESEKRYLSQGLICPFTVDGACSIYEVRPFTCAALVATTPPERCLPGSSESAKMYVSHHPAIFDTSFYYNKLDNVMLAFMPLTVYNILEGGYGFLSNIPGLEGLEEAAAPDGPTSEE